MVSYRAMLLALLIPSTVPTHAQNAGRVYLGENMAAKFESAHIVRGINGDYSLIEFLGYKTLRHELINSRDTFFAQRLGLIWHAKSIIVSNIDARAVFAKNNDSCIIDYSTRIDKLRHGRSALVSMVNLFSKRQDKNFQDEPDTALSYMRSQGTIRYNNHDAAFLYSMEYKNKLTPAGWLVLNGDTLHITQIKYQYGGKGNKEKAYSLSGKSFLLTKNNTVYAALDQSDDAAKVYLYKQLTHPKKLVIAAYLFIILCYQ